MLQVASLNSGSNGNCYYVGTKADALLVDAGISCRETERRMKRLELSMKRVRAILVTHEHADHIGGVSRLSRKYQLPVFITPATLQGSRLEIPDSRLRSFQAHEPIAFGELSVLPIPKLHDAADPHSFIISHLNTNIGVFTDHGAPDKHLLKYFAQCHAAFLESNYDEHMLHHGDYPPSLKERIRGGHGHLSNKQALELFLNHKSPDLTHLFLAHLSEHNNTPDLVRNLFSGIAGSTEIIIASRYEETAVYNIVPGSSGTRVSESGRAQQLTLFG